LLNDVLFRVSTSMDSRPLLFLDRDGTLIEDVGYPRDADRVVLLPGVGDALRVAVERYRLVVVSNQSGVARGLISRAEAAAVDSRFRCLFAAHDVQFEYIGYCFHGPQDGCVCRKPAPGLLLDARRSLQAADCAHRPRDVMIGDKQSDMTAGYAAGCYTIGIGDILDADRNANSWQQVLAHLKEFSAHD
jgi:D-glycero-D-manno-heptose 1,7-bisphosphate phosphatase